VCKILDYGKWKYEASQREKENRRKANTTAIKEMKYRPKIGPGDFETKTRSVAKFLGEGHKVKITIMFRGREVAHPELGMKILERIQGELGPFAKVEASPRLDGRNMTMVLAPDKRAQAAAHKAGADGHTPDEHDARPAQPQAAQAAAAPAAEAAEQENS
jgi:translation initiation factor IF-3